MKRRRGSKLVYIRIAFTQTVDIGTASRKMKGLLIVLVAAVVLASTQGRLSLNEDPIVQTAQGQLRGSILTSRKGRQIFSFRGVRFAQPPLGNLRFKAPVSPESWDGIRNATDDGFSCPQPEANTSYPTSEDCLFLNVYTTALPTSGENPNRPVLVYFHAGGWFSNTGASFIHGPQYLMDQDIVLVVTNYRLAALGFLSTGDGVLPGNYGMKDQVATLRWVQQNIAAFGGNPDNVTISGCSVGGASIWLHMVSPMSRGLFHRGISVSPSVNTFWDVTNDPLTQAKKQASLLNCPNDTSTQIAECLREKGAQEIASTYEDMLVWQYDPVLEYNPVIEQDTGEERYLTENPLKSFLDGNFVKIPWMTGMNKDEFNSWGYYVVQDTNAANEFYDRFEELAPGVLMYEEGTQRSHLASQTFKEFYLHNQPITNASRVDLGNLYSDAVIRYGQDITAKLVSELSDEPVYSYQFVYQGRYSHEYWPGTTTPYGVVHHDDLIYLFYISRLFPEFTPEDPESQMVEKLTTLWANFISTGNPTPTSSELLNNVTWERMTPENLAYLNIDSVLEMKSGMFQDRMAVWDELFPAQLQTSSEPTKSG